MPLARSIKIHQNTKLGIEIYSPEIKNTTHNIGKKINNSMSFKKPLNEQRIKEYLNALDTVKQGLTCKHNAIYKVNEWTYNLKWYFNSYKKYIDKIDNEWDMTYNFKENFLALEEDVYRKQIDLTISEESIEWNEDKIYYYSNLIEDIEELEKKWYDISNYNSNYWHALYKKIQLMKKHTMPNSMIEEQEEKLKALFVLP